MISYVLAPYSAVSRATDKMPQSFVDELNAAIDRFKCEKSDSVSKFIHCSMRDIEESHDGHTYLFITVLPNGHMEIVAFFELCLTGIDFSQLTKSMQKKFKGGHTHWRKGKYAGSYCIGELGRNDSFTKDDMPGERILQEAINVIVTARDSIGGRYALIDARREIFDHLYKKQGFRCVGNVSVPDEAEAEVVVGIAKTTKWEIEELSRDGGSSTADNA